MVSWRKTRLHEWHQAFALVVYELHQEDVEEILALVGMSHFQQKHVFIAVVFEHFIINFGYNSAKIDKSITIAEDYSHRSAQPLYNFCK